MTLIDVFAFSVLAWIIGWSTACTISWPFFQKMLGRNRDIFIRKLDMTHERAETFWPLLYPVYCLVAIVFWPLMLIVYLQWKFGDLDPTSDRIREKLKED